MSQLKRKADLRLKMILVSSLGFILEDFGCASHESFQVFQALCELLIDLKSQLDDAKAAPQFEALGIYAFYALR